MNIYNRLKRLFQKPLVLLQYQMRNQDNSLRIMLFFISHPNFNVFKYSMEWLLIENELIERLPALTKRWCFVFSVCNKRLFLKSAPRQLPILWNCLNLKNRSLDIRRAQKNICGFHFFLTYFFFFTQWIFRCSFIAPAEHPPFPCSGGVAFHENHPPNLWDI